MQESFVTILLAFLEGFALIISPCILPILPIILSGSLTGNKSRPLGIITGFIVTFAIVTLFSKSLIEALHINPDMIRNVSYVILILLGIMMTSTYLTEKFNLLTQRLTQAGQSIQVANNPQGGFFGGFIFGGLIGIIWTPCAGPILAAVIVQVVVQKTTLSSMLTVIAFAIGAGLPMLLIALIGRSILQQFRFIGKHTILFRKILGVILILSVLFLILIYNTPLSIKLTRTTPLSGTSLINGLPKPYPAPPIENIDAWINSPPLQLSQLKGQVVLIDFWTYSCINCLRTLPYLKDWYEKYHDKGLVIIGIHSPEFAFEHNLDNVKNAVAKLGILYPVALDNHFTTWQNYQNQYWPAHFLINKNGDVVYTHFGEGEYDVTESNIQFLLGISGPMHEEKQKAQFPASQTPETYFGYARSERFANTEIIAKGHSATYHYPDLILQNNWALNGNWIIDAEKITSASAGASIKLHFYAANVYAVMGVKGQPVMISVLLNGKPIITNKGDDVIDGQITVKQHQLYSVVKLNQASEGTVELIATQPGLEMYTFTFGS